MEQGRPDNQESALFRGYVLSFAKQVEEGLNGDEQMELDKTAGENGFKEDALRIAMENPERFKKELVELVQSLALTTGKRLFDSKHMGGLFVDQDGELVVIRNQELLVNLEDSDEVQNTQCTYEVLTGPYKGQFRSSREYPLWVHAVSAVSNKTRGAFNRMIPPSVGEA